MRFLTLPLPLCHVKMRANRRTQCEKIPSNNTLNVAFRATEVYYYAELCVGKATRLFPQVVYELKMDGPRHNISIYYTSHTGGTPNLRHRNGFAHKLVRPRAQRYSPFTFAYFMSLCCGIVNNFIFGGVLAQKSIKMMNVDSVALRHNGLKLHDSCQKNNCTQNL